MGAGGAVQRGELFVDGAPSPFVQVPLQRVHQRGQVRLVVGIDERGKRVAGHHQQGALPVHRPDFASFHPLSVGLARGNESAVARSFDGPRRTRPGGVVFGFAERGGGLGLSGEEPEGAGELGPVAGPRRSHRRARQMLKLPVGVGVRLIQPEKRGRRRPVRLGLEGEPRRKPPPARAARAEDREPRAPPASPARPSMPRARVARGPSPRPGRALPRLPSGAHGEALHGPRPGAPPAGRRARAPPPAGKRCIGPRRRLRGEAAPGWCWRPPDDRAAPVDRRPPARTRAGATLRWEGRARRCLGSAAVPRWRADRRPPPTPPPGSPVRAQRGRARPFARRPTWRWAPAPRRGVRRRWPAPLPARARGVWPDARSGWFAPPAGRALLRPVPAIWGRRALLPCRRPPHRLTTAGAGSSSLQCSRSTGQTTRTLVCDDASSVSARATEDAGPRGSPPGQTYTFDLDEAPQGIPRIAEHAILTSHARHPIERLATQQRQQLRPEVERRVRNILFPVGQSSERRVRRAEVPAPDGVARGAQELVARFRSRSGRTHAPGGCAGGRPPACRAASEADCSGEAAAEAEAQAASRAICLGPGGRGGFKACLRMRTTGALPRRRRRSRSAAHARRRSKHRFA